MNRAALAAAPLAASYAASIARVASWAIVFGIVYRAAGPNGAAQVSLLALARGTVGLFSYLSLGLTPVLVRELTHVDADRRSHVYSTAGLIVAVAALIGAGVLLAYVGRLPVFSQQTEPYRPDTVFGVFLCVGLGTLLRTMSDWPSSALLAGGRIVSDGALATTAEVVFVAAVWALSPGMSTTTPASIAPATAAAIAYFVASLTLLIGRAVASLWVIRPSVWQIDHRFVLPLLITGGGVLLSQLADWLYAPFNQILIHYYLDPKLVASYAIAIQIDGGLLLAVAGLSTVMLPASAIAIRDGRIELLRRQYILAVLASLCLLTAAAVVIVAFAQPLMLIWFGDTMPMTRAILPLVLIHTVIGGTATIGRAVLLGIGRVKAYTLSAIAGGLANAALAYLVLTQTSLGLRGVVMATVLTVAIRCGLWMPWYTLRCLRRPAASPI